MVSGPMAVSPPRPLHVALLLPLAGLLAWVAFRGRTTTEDPAAVLAALKAGKRAAAGAPALPAAAAAGAASRTEPTRYDRENLHELIDGAAEGYLSKGFLDVQAASYTFAGPAGKTFEVAAELHRFESAAGAEALAATERPPSAAPVAGASGAASDGSLLLAVRGSHLLKLTAFDPGSGERLAAIARAFAPEGAQK